MSNFYCTCLLSVLSLCSWVIMYIAHAPYPPSFRQAETLPERFSVHVGVASFPVLDVSPDIPRCFIRIAAQRAPGGMVTPLWSTLSLVSIRFRSNRKQRRGLNIFTSEHAWDYRDKDVLWAEIQSDSDTEDHSKDGAGEYAEIIFGLIRKYAVS